MYVTTMNVEVSRFEASCGGFVGYVEFEHCCPVSGDAGTAHFRCVAKVDQHASRVLIERALLDEACRQVNFMPEYRLGQKTLSFAELEEQRAYA